jgi:hypothetical protein
MLGDERFAVIYVRNELLELDTFLKEKLDEIRSLTKRSVPPYAASVVVRYRLNAPDVRVPAVTMYRSDMVITSDSTVNISAVIRAMPFSLRNTFMYNLSRLVSAGY